MRSSSAAFNPKSYNLTVLWTNKSTNCINFSCFEYKIFLKDLKSTLSSSVALWFRNLGNIRKTTDGRLPSQILVEVWSKFDRFTRWAGLSLVFLKSVYPCIWFIMYFKKSKVCEKQKWCSKINKNSKFGTFCVRNYYKLTLQRVLL